MKLIIILIVLTTVLVWPIMGSDFIFEEKNGTLHYQCKRPGLVGKAKVVKLSWGVFRVLGPIYSGNVSTHDPHKAAKKGCGETNIPVEQPNSNNKEVK